MRVISELELKEILDKHGKWLRNEEGGKRADLRSTNLSSANLGSANLRSADLRFADLSSANLISADLSLANLNFADLSFANLSSANLGFADLRSADLRFADLSLANLISADLCFADLNSADLRFADLRFADLMSFQYQKHTAFFTPDGGLSIGCHTMSVYDWQEMYFDIGYAEGYSEEQIEAYGQFIKQCIKLFESKNGVI